jgi:hypothetical protein
MQGVWRLLDEQNKGWEENVSNYGQCGKLSVQVFSTFSRPLLRENPFVTTGPGLQGHGFVQSAPNRTGGFHKSFFVLKNLTAGIDRHRHV